MKTRRLNCAIYTRKSTEEGLDQNYNSLDAQREACEAFVTSQKAEGWMALSDRYDDGGYSGGNINRPGLQKLIADIKTGTVNIIVVYKIDRLSRSLSDFAKLVDLFDEHQVTFVSVTQAFNTTTSMGRLTLNILLSFAQFEREVSGERVRDKFALSRSRGMWMGGMPPYGYDVRDRKLVVNPSEARLVQEIFARFAATPSMATLVRDLRARGLTTKSWITQTGIDRKGRLIDKAFIYKLFRNPVYIGIAAHKGTHYPGEHEAIVPKHIFDRVQAHLGTGGSLTKGRRSMRRTGGPYLLRGLLFSDHGRAFTPGYTSRGNKKYGYYINTDAIKIGADACEVRRIPAGEIETVVVERMRSVLATPEVIAKTIRVVTGLRPDIGTAEAIEAMQSIDEVWSKLFPIEQTRIVNALISRITIRPEGISIEWNSNGVADLTREVTAKEAA